MNLLIRIHVEGPGFLWEILDLDHGVNSHESLHLAANHVKAETTALRQAEKWVEQHESTLRKYWAGLFPPPDGPMNIDVEVTSEYSVR